MKLEFFVPGEPAPGGSKSAYALTDKTGKLIIKTNEHGRERPVLMWSDDAKGNKAWRKTVGLIAKNKMQWARLEPLAGPLRFACEFVMERGKTVKRVHHTIAPDLSKLIRSTEDALTGIAWVDDSQIVEHGRMHKRYQRPGEPTGAHIVIEAIEEALELALEQPAPSAKPQPKPEPALVFEDDPFK